MTQLLICYIRNLQNNLFWYAYELYKGLKNLSSDF